MRSIIALLLSCVAAFAAAPTVTTPTATAPVNGATTLSTTVSTNGATTNVRFRFGIGNTNESRTVSLSDSASPQTATVNLTQLVGNQTYSFSVEATNADAPDPVAVSGVDFLVPAYKPTIFSHSVQAKPGGKATFVAKVTANGAQTDVIFDYGKTSTYTANATGAPSVPANEVKQEVAADIDSLERGAVYHYRVTATSSLGTDQSLDATFVATANQAPIARADTFVVRSTDPVLIDVLKNDRDPEGDGMKLTSVSAGTQGVAEISGNQIKYTPRAGSTGAEVITYTVQDDYLAAPASSTGTLTIRAPGIASQGIHAVALTDADGNTIGLIRVIGTAGGSVTGKIQIYDQVHTIAGTLDELGRFHAVVPRGGSGPLDVTVSFDQSGDATSMKAQVFANGNEFTGEAPLGVFSDKRMSELTGTYTLTIPAPGGGTDGAALPGGAGYMRILVSEWGAVTYKGKLGDGTKFSGSSVLGGTDSAPTVPIWFTPDNTRFSTEVKFSSDASSLLTAAPKWYRAPDGDSDFYPDGFFIEGSATGGRYQKPEDGRRVMSPTSSSESKAILTFSNGNLSTPVNHQYEISKSNRLALLDPNGDGTSLKIDQKAGTFKGSFDHPIDGKTRKFQGVIVQQDGVGRGVFIGQNQSGSVEFRFGVVTPPVVTPPTTPTNPGTGNGNGNGTGNGGIDTGGIDLGNIDTSGLNLGTFRAKR